MKVLIEKLVIPLSRLADIPVPDRHLEEFIAEKLDIKPEAVTAYEILSKSVDARRKPEIYFIYRLNATCCAKVKLGRDIKPAIRKPSYDELPLSSLDIPEESIPRNPVVVGTGPAGLMAAFLLAKYGCRPLIIDRGFDVDRRERDIESFYKNRELNPESNFLFGEGGAGTYSDGKLYTRKKDPRASFILETFINAGAPEEIRYLKRPHIGSDILPMMVKNIRKEIEHMGGRFMWGRKVTGIIEKDGACGGVVLSGGDKIEAPFTVIAPGHSARELIKTLVEGGVENKLKDFQIGCRIEHSQEFVNRMQYGLDKLPLCLDSAEYNFVSRPSEDSGVLGASTFCMCPGGEIVPATSDPGQLSTNGMSRYARDEKFANAGIIVNHKAENFSSSEAAFKYIEDLERAAFTAGGGNYSSPAQGAYAFCNGDLDLPVNESSYRLGLVPARLDEILPTDVRDAIRTALVHFENLAPGFMFSGTIVGLETRVSSPVRFLRDPETLQSSVANLYIAGEGAGYAGGILSAAVDGLKMAESILAQ